MERVDERDQKIEELKRWLHDTEGKRLLLLRVLFIFVVLALPPAVLGWVDMIGRAAQYVRDHGANARTGFFVSPPNLGTLYYLEGEGTRGVWVTYDHNVSK